MLYKWGGYKKKDFTIDSWVNNMSISTTNETSCHWFTIDITEPLEPNSKTFDSPPRIHEFNNSMFLNL